MPIPLTFHARQEYSEVYCIGRFTDSWIVTLLLGVLLHLYKSKNATCESNVRPAACPFVRLSVT